ncbi:MAG: hypothetical protein AAFO99_08255 [Bacteroidota bacterium]
MDKKEDIWHVLITTARPLIKPIGRSGKIVYGEDVQFTAKKARLTTILNVL